MLISGVWALFSKAEQYNLSGLHSSCKTVIRSGRSTRVPATQPPIRVWGIVHSAGGYGRGDRKEE